MWFWVERVAGAVWRPGIKETAALPLTCRRAHRKHGPWSRCLEQETLDCLQLAQACSLDRIASAGGAAGSIGVGGGGCAAPEASGG
mgnify:CR=1 FL=1